MAIGPNKKAGEKGTNVRPSTTFTAERKKVYIGLVARSGRRVQSAKEIGVCYSTVCHHQNNDPDFAAAVDEAVDLYRDSIDEEVGRRGMKGVAEDIWYQGTVVGQRVVYSDQLLLAHARAHHPAYKEKSQEITLQGTVSMGLETLTDQDRDELKRILSMKAKEKEEKKVTS